MYLPEVDEHFVRHARRGFYHQRKTLLLAWTYLDTWRGAIDIGAHVGFMSLDMAKFFETVYAFEPNPVNAECLRKNVDGHPVQIQEVALTDQHGKAGMRQPLASNTGAWELCDGDEVETRRLDDYQLEDIDFIKIDVQGSEEAVLRGAVETIKKNKPVIMLEVPRADAEAYAKDRVCGETMRILEGLGAKPAALARHDMIFKW
jgi:FkbM family methyltransferase